MYPSPRLIMLFSDLVEAEGMFDDLACEAAADKMMDWIAENRVAGVTSKDAIKKEALEYRKEREREREKDEAKGHETNGLAVRTKAK